MSKEELLKEFLMDDLVEERGYMTKEEVAQLKFIDHSESKLIELIKLVILSNSEEKSVNEIVRLINKNLNK